MGKRFASPSASKHVELPLYKFTAQKDTQYTPTHIKKLNSAQGSVPLAYMSVRLFNCSFQILCEVECALLGNCIVLPFPKGEKEFLRGIQPCLNPPPPPTHTCRTLPPPPLQIFIRALPFRPAVQKVRRSLCTAPATCSCHFLTVHLLPPPAPPACVPAPASVTYRCTSTSTTTSCTCSCSGHLL